MRRDRLALTLPRETPDGTETKLHPFLWCLKHRLGDRNKSDLARYMKVRPHSVYKWAAECRADRNFPIPAERAVQAARFFDVPVSFLRPDLV